MVAQNASSSPAKYDRIPPHSEEAERGVLGAALLDAVRVLDLCVQRHVTPESFHVSAHAVLFEALGQMAFENRPIDLLTVGQFLRELGRLDSIGGTLFLDQLVDSTPTAAHAEYYIELVADKHLLRMILDRARVAIDACYTEGDDAPQLLSKVEQSFFDITQQQRTAVVPWKDLVKNVMGTIESIILSKSGVTGIKTGFKNLDDQLLGLQPSDMIILAARPSMGKTALALNIAENVALGKGDHVPRPVAVFSLEMSAEALVRRMVCCHARVSSHSIARGFGVSSAHHQLLVQAASILQKAPIYLDDTAGIEMMELRSRARRLKRKQDIQLIVVDYLQMLHFPTYSREDSRQQETSRISGALKAMAKELKVPVLVLSQLSRAPETRGELAVPKLSDLRDSGSIEQDADVVLLLRRPCRYPKDEHYEDKTLAVVEVAKHRNGPVGEVQLNFDEDYTRFEDRARGVDPGMVGGPVAEEVGGE